MRTLFVRGETGRGVRFCYVAKVDRIDAGIGEAAKISYPTIDLHYPQEVLPTVVEIAKEMERKKLFPKVYIEQKGEKAYLAVVFRLKPVDFQFLEKIFPGPYIERIKQEVANEELELVTTGEAEFGREDLQIFLNAFAHLRHFRLHIMDQEGKAPWRVQLFSFTEGLPTPIYRA